MNVIEESSKDPGLRKVLTNPYALAPAGMRSGPRQANVSLPELDAVSGNWIAKSTRVLIDAMNCSIGSGRTRDSRSKCSEGEVRLCRRHGFVWFGRSCAPCGRSEAMILSKAGGKYLSLDEVPEGPFATISANEANAYGHAIRGGDALECACDG